MSTLARAIELTGRLVAFDTESSKSNLPLIDFVEDVSARAGRAVRRACPTQRATRRRCSRPIGPMADGGVVLSGHTDVVPVAGQAWTGDPFTLRVADGARLSAAARST